MKEYEYSFEVKVLKPYIDYCLTNGYALKSDSSQKRILYRNENKTLARITYDKINGRTTKKLDFKDDKLSNEDLIVRRETLAIEFEDDEAILSILDFLNYKEENFLLRERIEYEKDGVKFELDSYIYPRKTYVVAIEGDRNLVDGVYKIVKEFEKSNK